MTTARPHRHRGEAARLLEDDGGDLAARRRVPGPHHARDPRRGHRARV